MLVALPSSTEPVAAGEGGARRALALFLAEQYAELIQLAAARCEAAGEPFTQTQKSVLLAVGAVLLRETR